MQSDCIACLKPIDGQGLCCKECEQWYHLGKCSSVTKTAYKSLSQNDAKDWLCPTCRLHNRRQGTGEDGPTAEATSLENLFRLMNSMNEKLTNVVLKINNLEQSIDDQSNKNDSVLIKLEEQGKTINDMEHSMELLAAKYDEILSTLGEQNRTINDLQKRTQELETAVREKDATILELKANVSSIEQYSRRKNVEIHGVQKKENEDLVEEVKKLAGKLRLSLPSTQDIEAAHRLPARMGKTPPILVRFAQRSMRDAWIAKRVALRDEKVFINENLTKYVKTLFWNAKNAAREKGYKFVWTRNGRVFVRQREGSAILRVETENDLLKIR